MNALRLSLFVLTAVPSPVLHAQTFDVNWSTVDGGGGTSSGASAFGEFTLSGTVGQPDAGVLSGGGFSISGGFWGFLGGAVTIEPPLLSIRVVGANAILVWPNSSAGYELQEVASLEGSSSLWNNVGQAPAVFGNEKQVILPPTNASRFFRLRKP